uniref:Uncharacterized protein n=1 Tax=Rhizophagus irregularis (strain DAOM 181602 / DAOM 197198 / MUCL 43194) TaxID=747089 RepID=U9UC45_RHIID
MVQLYADVILLIMLELQDDLSSLHSCVLVSRSWSRIAVPFLWKYFSCINGFTYNRDRESRIKLYKVIANFLPIESENLLIKITSKTLLELSTICQNIKILEINYCNEDSKGLASFIEMQHDLRNVIKEKGCHIKNIFGNTTYRSWFIFKFNKSTTL